MQSKQAQTYCPKNFSRHLRRCSAMFVVLSRSLTRRTVSYSIRCISQRPTGSTNNRIQDKPNSTSDNRTQLKSAANESQKTQSAQSEPSLDIDLTKTPSLDFLPPEVEKEFQRTGARSSKGSLSSSEKRRRFASRVTLALLALGFGAHTVFMGREWTDEELMAMKMVSPGIYPNACFL